MVVGVLVDVQPPTIVCPKELDVTVADWGDNSTIVHYDVQKPQATDNSGLVYYRVLGLPNTAGHVFPVGLTTLTYEAHDDAGNKASCVQYVHVRGSYRFSYYSYYRGRCCMAASFVYFRHNFHFYSS